MGILKMTINLAYLYLLSPLHTGATSQEGNVVGIAREAHTDLPYMPSSTIRGRLRAATTPNEKRMALWGNTLEDLKENKDQKTESTDSQATNLTQGSLWVGDASLLWFPVPSLSHGVVWVTSPLLLRRWLRFTSISSDALPNIHAFSEGNQQDLYLRDAVFRANTLQAFGNWHNYIPKGSVETQAISQVFVVGDRDCAVLIQSSLWRQVKIKLDEHKTVDGGFRYEEAIPPETVMYFPFGSTVASKDNAETSKQQLDPVLEQQTFWQFGGQESLGRGLVKLWLNQ